MTAAGALPHCDQSQALAATATGEDTGHPWLVLLTSILASSLAFVDGSVVNVGLPAIGQSLQGNAADLQWVVNAYLLPLSALLLFGGALGDRFGRRRLLIIGVGLFALGSLGCALAPSLTWLLLARGTQGLGAALLSPNSLAVLGGAFGPARRGTAVGIWAATASMAAALGPVLGGWLIDSVGWRAIFILNLPLAALAIGLAQAFIRDPPGERRGSPLDLLGAVLATLALGGLTWGLTVGSGPGGWTWPAGVAVVCGVVLAAAFIRTEQARGDRAMTPLALFGSRRLVGLNLMTLLLYGTLGGFLLMLPYVLIEAAGYTATAAGAALLPFPLIIAVASPIMGPIASRIGPRTPLALGSLVVALGLLLAMRIDGTGTYVASVLPCVVVVALGLSGAAAPLTTAILAAVDARHTGSASGLNSAVARTGGLIATALLGGVLAASGSALLGAFRIAAVAGAAAALGAAASVFFALRTELGAEEAKA